MRPVDITKSLTAASANCIALSQSVASGASMILNGGSVVAGTAVLDTQRRVAIVSAGNDSAISATISGTRGGGQAIGEVLPLTNIGTAVSVLDYLNITKITMSGATASTVTAGTNATGSTDWIMPNFHLTPFMVDINTQVSGTVTYNIETTLDDYWTVVKPTKLPNIVAVLSNATVAAQQQLTAPVTGYRYTITAGTGVVTAEGVQAGIVNY
jgi:hypothetical protein